ncbi:MAG: hypothetical protein V1492_05150 [Candidatus Micrarchaeota archaeon]
MNFDNAQELRKYLLEQFGLVLPQNVQLTKTKGHGIRVHRKGIRTDRIFGLEGYMAYSNKAGINPYFMQLFGHLATKNVLAVNEEDAKKYTAGEPLKKKIKIARGEVLLVHKCHVLGYGIHDGKGGITCPLREKRRRKLSNSIGPWPGRLM